MRKLIWTTLIIVIIPMGLFAIKEIGASTQPISKSTGAVIFVSNRAQDVGTIDVYIDRQLVKANLSTTDPEVSIEVSPGSHLIDIFPAGQHVVLIKTTDLVVGANRSYHFSLTGREADWSVALVSVDAVVG